MTFDKFKVLAQRAYVTVKNDIAALNGNYIGTFMAIVGLNGFIITPITFIVCLLLIFGVYMYVEANKE